MPNEDFIHSSLREKLLEHLFVGELLRCLWKSGRRDIEVLRAEIDTAGYDLVIECDGVMRHVQLKSSHANALTREVKIQTKLETKPSACVVWIYFKEQTLELGPFYWFGGSPRSPMPPLGDRIATHTKRDRHGIKAPRENLRLLSKNKFSKLKTIEEVVAAMFGPIEQVRSIGR